MDGMKSQQSQVKNRRRSSLNVVVDAIRQGTGGSIPASAAARPQTASQLQSSLGNGDPSWMMPEGRRSELGPQPMFDNGNPSWMSDYSTMGSQRGYYTSLLSQDGANVLTSDDCVEVDNEVEEVLPVNEMNSQPNKKGRSKNFSEEEDMMLVSGYLNISNDPITGRDQKEGTFWERVWIYFHKNRTFDSDRNPSSLKHRYATIQREVTLFQACYAAIERKNESGKTIDDKIAEAKDKFRKGNEGKAFSVFHAWVILRHEPKYALRESKVTDYQDPSGDGPVNAERESMAAVMQIVILSLKK